jgi:hypothetical protein
MMFSNSNADCSTFPRLCSIRLQLFLVISFWHKQYLLEDYAKIIHSKIEQDSSRQSAGNSSAAGESEADKDERKEARQYFKPDHSTLEWRRDRAVQALLALEIVVEINQIEGKSKKKDRKFTEEKYFTKLKQQVEFLNIRPNSDKVFTRAGDQLVNRVCQSPAAAARRGTVLTCRPPVQTFELFCYVWSLGKCLVPY